MIPLNIPVTFKKDFTPSDEVFFCDFKNKEYLPETLRVTRVENNLVVAKNSSNKNVIYVGKKTNFLPTK